MLREALEWFLTPAGPAARKLGYLGESIALEARFRRNRAAWAPHLEASRRAVADAADASEGTALAVVLGSGPLLDVPLGHLLRRFDRVILVDILHPWRARGIARRTPKLFLMEADLSGIADAVVANPRHMPAIRPPDALDGLKPDFTVSLNLLSQLAQAPWKALGAAGHPQDALAALHADLARTHLDWLSALPGRRCMIADQAQETEYPDRTEIWRPLDGLALPAPDRNWDWQIAPAGERGDGAVQTNRVAAWLDLPGPAATADGDLSTVQDSP